MAPSGAGRRTDEAVRQEAIAWLARLRAPDGGTDHQAFEDWYAADPRHADIYDDVLKNWEAMAVAGETPAAQARQKPSRPPSSRLIAWTAVAAAVAAALLLVPGSPLNLSGPSSSEAQTLLASHVGEIRNVDLPDGSQVTLDTDSRLTILYTDSERRLRLESGRARFRVVHGDSRAFLVEAGSTEVIAHGTVFDVDVAGSKVAVSLLEGSVEVRPQSAAVASRPSASTVLKPGQHLLVAQGQVPQPLKTEEPRWTSGMLSFEDAELSDVVSAANRYSEVKILISDPAIGRLRFSGTFDPREPDDLAQSLARIFNLRLDRDSDGMIYLQPSAATEK
ncbi:FecR family protein [Sandaracinobacteroides hominis]|uniref:FecR family protein n=1 Tax=Sandaracinobacteroides hominis TaxID=2780086 RepID=UPI0018F2E45A|nr:FecR domain-containing protein [Sandaracinobacteroides hominis]